MFSNSCVFQILSFSIILCSFFSCQKEEIVNNDVPFHYIEDCNVPLHYGELSLMPETLTKVPYEGNEKLVFSNKETGEEMVFLPKQSGFPTETYQERGASIPCGEETLAMTYDSGNLSLIYSSNQKYGIYIKLSVEAMNRGVDREKPLFYDLLQVQFYNPFFDDNGIFAGTDDCFTNIIGSMRTINESTTFIYDNTGHLSFPQIEHDYTLDGKTYEMVYIANGEKIEKTVYSPTHGLLEFTDLDGQTWSFDRNIYYDDVFAADISLPNADEDIIKLSEIDADLILLDFWASWCAACRVETTNTLVPLYEQYQTKGLEIYSVSIDTDKEEWLKAIEEDEMSWLNVCDFQAYDSPVFEDYQVLGIPTTYLIDEEGKIIAKDLKGEDLVEFVEDYLD